MKYFVKAFGLTAIAGLGLCAGAVSAATADGNVGANSTGTLDVSLTTVDTVQVKGLAAIDMSSTYSATDVDGVYGGNAFCVHRNGGESYKFTVTWSALAGTSSGNTDTIALSIKVDDDDDASDGDDVSTGSQLSTAYAGSATRGSSSCDNASIYASATDTNVRAASTDTYTTQVTVRVDPV